MTHTDPDVLVHLHDVGKDYPVLHAGNGRFRMVLDLLTGHAIKDHFRALEGIDLAIRRGESLGIIGENGAGKSTLLKIIAGVVKPTRGQVRVVGRVSALLELGTGFHPEFTGRENIHLASALMGLTRQEADDSVDDILAFADIGEHIDQPIKTYSSGMVVRLGFAVATAVSPDVLVTDEVLAVGDESFQKKCMRWMEAFRGRGGTLLLCSHSMYHIQSLCQRAVWIQHGKMHAHGEAFDVTQAYLAYHEAKNRSEEDIERHQHAPQSVPLLDGLWVQDAAAATRSAFDAGENISLCGTYTTPDDSPTVIMAGVVRVDGTPVFGTFSNDAGYAGTRIGPGRYAFRIDFPAHALLPGSYLLRAHTLDEHGLRLFDTREIGVTVRGKTRDHGLVRLQHAWMPAADRPLQ